MLAKSEAKNGSLLSFLVHHYQLPRTHSRPYYQSKIVTEVLTTEKNSFERTENDR